jgi:hypothetical protein
MTSTTRARDSRGRFTSTTPSEPARLGGFTESDTVHGYVLTSTGWQKPGAWQPKVAPVETAAEGFKRQQQESVPLVAPVEPEPGPSNLNGFLGFMTFMGALFVVGPLVSPAQAWVVFAVVLLASAIWRRWFMVPFVLLTGIPALLVLVALTAGLIVLPLVAAIAVLGYKGAREVKFWA